MNIFATIGAGVSVAAGVLGFLWPHQVSKVIGLGLPSGLAISEFRATYGGLFIGAGIAVLMIGSSDAASVLGAALAGAFVARAASVVIDRSRSKENIAGLVIEAAVATLLLLG
jgi:hypothetical protein